MEYFPAALEKLVEQFARLPGIGSKSAQRLAFFVLSLPEEEAKAFADAIVDAKRTVTFCPVCRNLTDGGLCPICSSPKRDEHVICVVADPRDVVAIERAREYNGRYHVLHGVISPMNHVGPDDLEIKPLLDRVAQGNIEEVIMATNPDTEGEATAMYLARLLRPFGVRVTRLAYGIPVGGHLEFADDATLMRFARKNSSRTFFLFFRLFCYFLQKSVYIIFNINPVFFIRNSYLTYIFGEVKTFLISFCCLFFILVDNLYHIYHPFRHQNTIQEMQILA